MPKIPKEQDLTLDEYIEWKLNREKEAQLTLLEKIQERVGETNSVKVPVYGMDSVLYRKDIIAILDEIKKELDSQ